MKRIKDNYADSKRLLCFILFPFFSIYILSAQTPYADINEAIATGFFAQAQQLIGKRIAQDSLSPTEVYDLELQSALLNRIRIDFNRVIVNDDFSGDFFPAKSYPRSETVDFQRGEVEWRGGNLYFDQWSYDMEVEYLE